MPGTLVSSGEGLWVVEAFLRGGGGGGSDGGGGGGSGQNNHCECVEAAGGEGGRGVGTGRAPGSPAAAGGRAGGWARRRLPDAPRRGGCGIRRVVTVLRGSCVHREPGENPRGERGLRRLSKRPAPADADRFSPLAALNAHGPSSLIPRARPPGSQGGPRVGDVTLPDCPFGCRTLSFGDSATAERPQAT